MMLIHSPAGTARAETPVNAIDGVNLDQTFISDSMIQNKKKFITSTIELFKSLNLFIVLEGVERPFQKFY